MQAALRPQLRVIIEGRHLLPIRNATLSRHEAVKASRATERPVAAAGAIRVRAAEPVEFVVPQAAFSAVRACGSFTRAHDGRRLLLLLLLPYWRVDECKAKSLGPRLEKVHKSIGLVH